jgi:toxin ParE1/3/4
MLLKSQQTYDDLSEIWLRIAVDNERAADEVLNRIENALFSISDNPFMGRALEHSNPKFANWRVFPVRGYIAFYRPIDNGVYIERIIHSAMDIGGELENI